MEHERKISKVKYQSLSLSILPSSKKFNYDETQVVTTIM